MFIFTPEERRIIIFLVSIALVGMGINYLAKNFAPVKTVICFNDNLGKLNLNTANQDDLITIPGIGKKLAERIIEYRKQNITFGSINDLENIKGFKGHRFEKVKKMFYVD